MNKIAFTVVSMLLSAPAFAGPALDSLIAASGVAQELRGPVPAAAPTVAEQAPAQLKWELDTSYRPASSEFAWGEKKYSLRVLFSRGVYDPYVKNFKAQALLMLEDSDNNNWPCFPFDAAFDNDFILNEGPHDHINVFRQGNTLTVSGCDENVKCTELASVPVKSLYLDWQARTGKTVLNVEEKTFFAAPQGMWDGERWSYGYVLSENFVAQPTTGMPQDFVELFRDNTDGLHDLRPKAYSLALGLAFELSGNDGGTLSWTVRPMLESELQEATNDALGRRSVNRPAAAAVKAVK